MIKFRSKINQKKASSLATQFFRETKGGTRPDKASQETKEKIFKNIKMLKNIQTPGVKRMVNIFLSHFSADQK
jgi:hypothetical protein|tara:strand:- start:69 stop:287 length:219 start_codon:yes stop_codon:yes gene_type:complete